MSFDLNIVIGLPEAILLLISFAGMVYQAFKGLPEFIGSCIGTATSMILLYWGGFFS